MNENDTNTFCKKLVSACVEKKLGAFVILIDEEGIAEVNHFPEWSVLQYSDKTDKITLSKTDADTPQEWFKKCENTLNFLTAVAEQCLEMGELCNILRKALLEAVEESFSKENFIEKVIPSTTETLH